MSPRRRLLAGRLASRSLHLKNVSGHAGPGIQTAAPYLQHSRIAVELEEQGEAGAGQRVPLMPPKPWPDPALMSTA